MSYAVIDIETDHLNASVIHCVVVNDKVFTSPDGLGSYLSTFDHIVAHNGIQFDFPVLKKLWNISIPAVKQYDTLIASRLAQPDIEGGHSLEAWGNRLGYPKLPKPDWKVFTPEMLEYCKVDVEICTKLYKKVQNNLEKFSKESILSEFKLQRLINKVRDNGFYFKEPDALSLLNVIEQKQNAIKQEIDKVFKPEIKQLKTKEKVIPFNINSRDQIAKRLIALGWKPTLFTPSGKPKVDEIQLEKFNSKESNLLAENFMLSKRSAMLKSWIKANEPDSRVRCFYHSLGAVTNRMSCSKPNLQQVPSNRKPYGKECRQLWSCSPGNILVGSDAQSLELRVLAHYINDPEYTKEVLEGDVHTANQKAAGLSSRDQAKTFIYALCYGAGDAKLGKVVNGTAKDGAMLRASFFKKIPAFKKFSDAVIRKGETEGKLIAIDGRILTVRSAHASLNTLIQGSSAVLMKNWFMNTALDLKRRSVDARVIAMVHDEIILECLEKDVDIVSDCVKLSIEAVNKQFNIRCDLGCDINFGNDWSEIH
jgi:DNA polymerase I-like protein with 3'-5' exonuclease and polymerase domains